jgi:hypothetical protein
VTTTPSPTPNRRRWLQFSLRTLLVIVLIVTVPLGWFGVQGEAGEGVAESG